MLKTLCVHCDIGGSTTTNGKSTFENQVEVIAIVLVDHLVTWLLVVLPDVVPHQHENVGAQTGLHVLPNIEISVDEDAVLLVHEQAGQPQRSSSTTEIENCVGWLAVSVCVLQP